MRFSYKILLNFVIFAVILVLFYAYQIETKRRAVVSAKNITFAKQPLKYANSNELLSIKPTQSLSEKLYVNANTTEKQNENNVWCIFTKVSSNMQMKHKFERFASSLIGRSSVFIALHMIVDTPSKTHAEDILKNVKILTNKTFLEFYYEVDALAEKLEDVISSMQPHFSSQPGTYYSDALFFLSLGLHRIAKGQTRAIMFDADTKLLEDVALLFQEFDKFNTTTLFGFAPELSPVYHHILYLYRSKYKNTIFGEPIKNGGYPGVNSGVIMFHFDNIRKSETYNDLLKPESVHELTTKYNFKGHLGDQDFYTLLGMEYPSMIYMLRCEWNRQLCTWWKNHGYQDIFDDFFHCQNKVKIYHGNCNTAIPDSPFFPV